jgi:hypothetical protein
MLAARAFSNTQISQIDIQYGQFSGSLGTYMSMADDFFRNRLDQMIALRHPLAVLANRMPCQEIEGTLAHRLARLVSSGKKQAQQRQLGRQVGGKLPLSVP